jgi:hypothetical protein
VTKVEISVAGHQVIVEAEEALDVVAARALALYRQTGDPLMTRGYPVTGCTGERADGPSYTEPTGADCYDGTVQS